MYKKKNNFIVIAFFALLASQSLSAENNCKERLPKAINDFSPTIVPVISIDRKEHPENIGNIQDIDEIWFSEKKEDNSWSEPQRLPKPYNTTGSDVLFSLSPDGCHALIYGKYVDKKLTRKSPGYSLVKRNGNTFGEIIPLEIDNYYNYSNNYYAHLSYDENTILFSLKRKDTYGGDDIYVSFKNSKTQRWPAPVNIGKVINTDADDISPTLALDGITMYFSSNRKNNYGEYDIFMTRRLDDTWLNWSEPLNIGSGINSKFKETGFSLNALSDSAYIVSSESQIIPTKDENKLFDTIDMRHGIYQVCVPNVYLALPYAIVKGNLYTFLGNTKTFLNKDVKFDIELGNVLHKNYSYTSYSSGQFLFVVPNNTEAKIRVSADGYENYEFSASTKSMSQPDFIYHDIVINPIQRAQDKEMACYFDDNSSKLTVIQEKELFNKLLALNNIIEKKFLVLGHADERGTEEYNFQLSKDRAATVKDILISIGIKTQNITVEAKGESTPVSKDNKLNRRVEIYIGD